MSTPIAASDCSPASIVKRKHNDEESANADLIFYKYKDRVATLPKEKGWSTKNLYLYQGFWHQSMRRVSVESVMAVQDTFTAHPSDIYLATTPKSGTTWLKALMFALVHRDRYKINSLSSHPLLVSNPHICLPYIEYEVFKTNPTYVDVHSPRLFATHISYTSLPQSIIDHGCRLIYLCRNPKDILVSLFHFENKRRDKSCDLMRFEEAFELFTKGIMVNGPYWDHVKGYYKVSLKNPENALFLTYEDLTRDTANNVKRLAKFMGCPITEEEEVNGVVQEIVSLCSFEKLSEVNKHGNLVNGLPNEVFFREGKVGGWINHLTDEMSYILDEITEEKFRGLSITF